MIDVLLVLLELTKYTKKFHALQQETRSSDSHLFLSDISGIFIELLDEMKRMKIPLNFTTASKCIRNYTGKCGISRIPI